MVNPGTLVDHLNVVKLDDMWRKRNLHGSSALLPALSFQDGTKL